MAPVPSARIAAIYVSRTVPKIVRLRYCSTGEQKALLIALMLAYVRLLAEARRG